MLSAPVVIDEMWFDFNGIPLKWCVMIGWGCIACRLTWRALFVGNMNMHELSDNSRHYPIGVLYDLLATQQDLPWSVTVHFQEFPSSVLLRCGAEDEVKSHVNNTLKEVSVGPNLCNNRV